MNCEVCGQKIIGRPIRAVIEGVALSVCRECSQLGEIVSEVRQARGSSRSTIESSKPQRLPAKAQSLPKEVLEREIIEDYARKIKNAREKAGIKQEELAKRINEKLSVIQKIEAGRIVPDLRLARILEHFLKIKLIVPMTEPSIPVNSKIPELTFGDLVKIKNKGKKNH
ncbi:MAG: multiprotein bridging factor aMBF1 [Candidatus Bathyarchaeia archaeon]